MSLIPSNLDEAILGGSIKLLTIQVYKCVDEVKVNLRITPPEGKAKHLVMTLGEFLKNKEQITEVATDIGSQLSEWKEETNKKTAPKKTTPKPKATAPSVNADAQAWGKERGYDAEKLLKDKEIVPTKAGKVTVGIIKKYHEEQELRKKKESLTAPSESRVSTQDELSLEALGLL